MRVVLVEVVEVVEQKAVVPRVHLHWSAKAGPRLSQSPPTITVGVGVGVGVGVVKVQYDKIDDW